MPKLGKMIDATLDPSARALDGFFSRSRSKEISNTLHQAAKDTMPILRKETPKKTHALVNSQAIKKFSDLEYHIQENVTPPYGLFQRQGVAKSKINPILPRKKKALWWPGARHPVRAVRNHPGIKKNDYYARTVNRAAPIVKRNGEKLGITINVELGGI